MNFTKILPNVQNDLENILNSFPLIARAVSVINSRKGEAFLVGGAIRDLLLGLPVNDIDIEVHGLSYDELVSVLGSLAPVSLVGKSFGVLKYHNSPIDWSLPRTDSEGRKPEVLVNPFLGIIEALRRRDLTMNAMAINLATYELIDPFNGYNDLKKKVLRSPDTTFFTQDPLRFYRVMQFISRFEMIPDSALEQVCKTMNIRHVSRERIEGEFEKLLLKSRRPSLGLRWLKSLGRLPEIFPELANTITTRQDPIWHPEGFVFEHLMQSVDASALLAYDNNEQKLVIMYSALCHDLGKVSTTQLINGRLRSPGHAEAGVPIAHSFLKKITRSIKLISAVKVLVKYHMQPGQFIKLNSSPAAYKRLALKLASSQVTLAMLAKLALADHRGRNGKGHEPLRDEVEFVNEFIKRAEAAFVLKGHEEPILHGRDIKDIVSPGPLMGQLLKYAYKIQLNKGINDKDTLKEIVEKQLKTSLNTNQLK